MQRNVVVLYSFSISYVTSGYQEWILGMQTACRNIFGFEAIVPKVLKHYTFHQKVSKVRHTYSSKSITFGIQVKVIANVFSAYDEEQSLPSFASVLHHGHILLCRISLHYNPKHVQVFEQREAYNVSNCTAYMIHHEYVCTHILCEISRTDHCQKTDQGNSVSTYFKGVHKQG